MLPVDSCIYFDTRNKTTRVNIMNALLIKVIMMAVMMMTMILSMLMVRMMTMVMMKMGVMILSMQRLKYTKAQSISTDGFHTKSIIE